MAIFNPIAYLKESKAELDKVIWPTRMGAAKLTVMVILVTIIVGAYIAGLDALFAKVAEKFIK